MAISFANGQFQATGSLSLWLAYIDEDFQYCEIDLRKHQIPRPAHFIYFVGFIAEYAKAKWQKQMFGGKDKLRQLIPLMEASEKSESMKETYDLLDLLAENFGSDPTKFCESLDTQITHKVHEALKAHFPPK